MTENSQIPLISIVTVCYNASQNIKSTAESIVSQRLADIEWIVIDGGSTDNTLELLTPYRSRITSLVSEKDNGIYDAMNKGVTLCTGQWILFLNSGDTFCSDSVLAKATPYLIRPDFQLVYGDVEKRDYAGVWFIKKAEVVSNKHRLWFCHQSLFTRRELLTKTPFDTSLRMSADFKFVKQSLVSGERFHQLAFAIARFDTNGISNVQRINGLKENLKVVLEFDHGKDRIRNACKLIFVIVTRIVQGKK